MYFCDDLRRYTTCSRISDLYDLQRYLDDAIRRCETQIDLEQHKANSDPTTPSSRSRVALRQELVSEVVAQCFSEGIVSIPAIKTAFFHKNAQLPLDAQFHPVNGAEIRAKLRELRGESSSLRESSESARIAALQRSIAQRRQLGDSLHAAELELLRLRQEHGSVASDVVESTVDDVSPSTDVTPLNFDAYCCDVVKKRLHGDIERLLQWMQQGFWSVYDGVDALKLMSVSGVQHKLFPLDPVTVDLFHKNSRCPDTPVAALMWRVMREDLTQEQVQNVFFFATNWHTVSGAPRKVDISFERRAREDDVAPRASTCSWSLRMPDCLAPGDNKGNSSVSRERMLQGTVVAAHIFTVINSHTVRSVAHGGKCGGTGLRLRLNRRLFISQLKSLPTRAFNYTGSCNKNSLQHLRASGGSSSGTGQIICGPPKTFITFCHHHHRA